MSTYEYKDMTGKLAITALSQIGRTNLAIYQDEGMKRLNIDNADAPTVAAELLKAAGQEGVIVPKSTAEVVVVGNGVLECGDGPERAYGSEAENPNWLRNKAANCIAIAEWIEGESAREAARKAEAEAAEKKLQERRDVLAKKAGHSIYMYAPQNIKTLIAQVVDLQDKLDGASHD